MKQLHSNAALDTDTLVQQDDSYATILLLKDQESEIEDGNLQDYLDIYGEQDDIS